ncbi:hypothetical protein HYY69_05175 [Candidatus Woesearchaeota archaeon]|nr:hypothetical protein [Candidatus Woesearchaeota archaeon]
MVKKSMNSSEANSKESLYTPIGAIVALLLITLIAVYSTGSNTSNSSSPTGLAIGMSCQADADCGNVKEVCYSNVCVSKAWVYKLNKMSASGKQKALQTFQANYKKSQEKKSQEQQPTPPVPQPSEQPKEQPSSAVPSGGSPSGGSGGSGSKKLECNPNFDYNGDGWVGKKDSDFLIQIVMKKQSCPSGKTCDVDGDGNVNTNDLQAFVNANQKCLDTALADPSLEKSVCGNNFLETGEVCDGTQLQPTSCPTGTTGTVTSCKTDCSGPDTSKCLAPPKCTKGQWGGSYYGTKMCANNDDLSWYANMNTPVCNDDPAKGTLGCCQLTSKSVTCDGNSWVNVSVSSCTGQEVVQKYDCSSKSPQTCGTLSNGKIDCVPVKLNKCTKLSSGWYIYGSNNCGFSPESCNDDPSKGKVGCCTEKLNSWVCDAAINQTLVCTTAGSYGNQYCGSTPGSCNDNPAKGKVGCCTLDLVPDSLHCEGNILVNQTINSCTNEKTTNKLDCTIPEWSGSPSRVCDTIGSKPGCYQTCTEKGLPLGSSTKIMLNTTQSNVALPFNQYSSYCSLDGLKIGKWLFVDASGKLCDKDEKLKGCYFDTQKDWSGKSYTNAYYYTFSCSDSGKAYITETNKWCGDSVNSCNPSTGCVKK